MGSTDLKSISVLPKRRDSHRAPLNILQNSGFVSVTSRRYLPPLGSFQTPSPYESIIRYPLITPRIPRQILPSESSVLDNPRQILPNTCDQTSQYTQPLIYSSSNPPVCLTPLSV